MLRAFDSKDATIPEWIIASLLTKLFSNFVQRRTLAKARDKLFNLWSLFCEKALLARHSTYTIIL